MRMNEELEKIRNKIFKTRLNPNQDYSNKWTLISIRDLRPNMDEKIEELLKQGKILKGGYFCTAVRGYHEYYLMVKTA